MVGLTFAVSLIVSEIQAVLMLKTTFLPTPGTPLVGLLDLEFEGHAVRIWRRNLAPKLESWVCHTVKKS